MAKNKKISTISKERHSNHSLGRKPHARRIVQKYHLIVCEGKETEVNYFEALKRTLPQRTLEITKIKVEGVGKNTDSLVKKALDIKRNRSNTVTPIDKVWVVFDKDSFPTKNFNDAIRLCEKELKHGEEIEAVWTNESFELWFLLHFKCYEQPMSRDQYGTKLEHCFKEKKNDGFKYEKNDPQIFELLQEHGNQKLAIENAKKLEALHGTRTDYANMNPCTKVHHLVAELLGITL